MYLFSFSCGISCVILFVTCTLFSYFDTENVVKVSTLVYFCCCLMNMKLNITLLFVMFDAVTIKIYVHFIKVTSLLIIHYLYELSCTTIIPSVILHCM